MSLITEVIGDTPMIRLQRSAQKGRVFLKLESSNPGGSIKDRPALQMLQDLLASGKIKEDTVLIEPTSGNTGIGLCMCAAAMGLKMTIVMPTTMSIERQKIMKAYGANLILSEGKLGVKGSVALAEEIHKKNPNSYIVGQFYNQSNPKAHELTTGPEIIKQCEKYKIDPAYLVCGVGSGGTLTGLSRVLKPRFTNMKVVAIEPETSQVLAGKPAGAHKIQGIAPGFLPDVMDMSLVDIIQPISDEEAYKMAQITAKREGVLVGISSGAAIAIAIKLANESGKDVLVIAADSGERYLSVEGLF